MVRKTLPRSRSNSAASKLRLGLLFTVGAVAVIVYILFPVEAWADLTSISMLFRFALLIFLAWILATLFLGIDQQFRLIQRFVTVIIPLVALLFLLLLVCDADLAERLSREDEVLENIQAVALFIAALSMAVTAVLLGVERQVRLVLMAIMIGVVFFVMGMEEISWMQRVLELESSEFFLEHNMQNEMNLHNLNTPLFENIFYLGGFVLLVLLPFYRVQLAQLLGTWRLTKGWELFLPGAWLFVPFSVMVGFVWPNAIQHPTVILALATTMVMLLIELNYQLDSRGQAPYWGLRFGILLFPLLVLLATAVAILLSGRVWDLGLVRPKEYMETLLAIGILIYSIDVWSRLSVIGSVNRPK